MKIYLIQYRFSVESTKFKFSILSLDISLYFTALVHWLAASQDILLVLLTADNFEFNKGIKTY